jgi:hypothetical protein
MRELAQDFHRELLYLHEHGFDRLDHDHVCADCDRQEAAEGGHQIAGRLQSARFCARTSTFKLKGNQTMIFIMF